MSTLAQARPAPRSPARLLLRVAVALLAGLVLAVLGAAAWLYATARSALPQLEGTIKVAGLSAPVTVVRDAQGVPHITAANLGDLFFAQGYVTAQDRLWQMDMSRRYAGGELSEVLGPELGGVDFVQLDRRQRILGLRATAERMVAALPADELAHAQAYARGVNACLDSVRGHLPIEFRILGYRPRPWTLADSYLIGLNMSELLSPALDTQLTREKVLARLGPALAADFYRARSWRDHPPGSDAHLQKPSTPEDEDDEDDDMPDTSRASLAPAALPPASRQGLLALLASDLAPGSNDWVVSGEHTVSGKPLLSNDMHLPHSVPGVWYEAHLQAGDFDVAGVTLPGVPYVIVGHNRRIAWGFTALVADVHDLFVESFNPAGQYLTPQGWVEPEHRREVIRVKGRREVVLDVLVTRHGPVVTSLFPGESRKLALAWTVYDTAGYRVPFEDLDRAANWEEFRHALSAMSSPVLNAVYADVDGHIGYQAVGRVPVRKGGDGSVPEPGSDASHDWSGYIPFPAMPSVFDPPSGILATANNRVTPDGYPYFITAQWFSPYRAERIYRVLESGRKFAPADMLALQTDIYSDLDHYCAERFVTALDRAPKLSGRARQAADLMRTWDGRFTLDSAAATVEVRARAELARRLLASHLGDMVPPGPQTGSEIPVPGRVSLGPVALEEILLRQPQRWLPPGYANYNDLLVSAVEAAVAEKDAPRDLAAWRWGQASPIVLRHPVFGGIPLLAHWAGPGRHPQSGGSYTVKQVGRSFGPSERMTVDLSDLDGSTLNLVTGESGEIFSPHFMDQWQAWYEGTTFALPFSAAAVHSAATHTLTLQPAK